MAVNLRVADFISLKQSIQRGRSSPGSVDYSYSSSRLITAKKAIMSYLTKQGCLMTSLFLLTVVISLSQGAPAAGLPAHHLLSREAGVCSIHQPVLLLSRNTVPFFMICTCTLFMVCVCVCVYMHTCLLLAKYDINYGQ